MRAISWALFFVFVFAFGREFLPSAGDLDDVSQMVKQVPSYVVDEAMLGGYSLSNDLGQATREIVYGPEVLWREAGNEADTLTSQIR